MRKARPNTAVVEVVFRVPKGFTAAQAKKLVWNHFTGHHTHYLGWEEEEAMGTDVVRFKARKARIERPKKC